MSTPSPVTRSFKDLALPLIALNIPVIPCQPLAKHTFLKGGPERGTVDPAVIAVWNAENPAYNVGCLGTLDNLALFDCDEKGLVSQIEQETGHKMPPTFTVKSANKGTAHLYFKQTERTRALGNAVHRAGEVRGNNEYLVGPGSVIVCEDGSTRAYEIWRNVPFADFPDWLVDWVVANPASSVRNAQTGELEGDVFSKLKEIYLQNLDPEEWFGRKDIPTITSLHPMLMSLGALLHDGERTADEIAELLDRVGHEYGHRDPLPKDTRDVAEWVVKRKPCELTLPEGHPLLQGYSYGLVTFGTEEAYAVFKNRCEQTPAWEYAAEWKDPEGWPEWPADYQAWRARQPEGPPKTDPRNDGPTFMKPRVLGGDFDFVLNPLGNETDGCFPRGEVSLIAASSGGGKTTLMMTLLEDQKAARPVFGHTTNGLPYLLVLEDRSEASLRRTFKRMRLDIESTPYRLLDRKGRSLAQAVADILDTTDPTPAVVFIEGLDLATEDAGKMEAVSRTLKSLLHVAQYFHVAIIGSVGCPKMKPRDRYASLRDTVFGSAAWARKVETIMTLQKSEGHDTDETTLLTVLPRNAKHEIYKLKFEGGRLVKAPPEAPDASEGDRGESVMEHWAQTRKEPFTRAEFALDFPGSETTIRRRLDKLEAMQIVEKSRIVRKGVCVYVYTPKEFALQEEVTA